MISKIILASPRGPCAGVNRALEIIERVLEKYTPPVYVNHELVHNRHVVEDLKNRGVLFTSNIDSIPDGTVYLFSAHGVSPDFRKKVLKKDLIVIDATCPLVTKVHDEAKRYAEEGFRILFIGHKGHPEVEGTMGVVSMELVESLDDVKKIKVRDKKTVVLTQTTLSVSDTAEILIALETRFPKLQKPKAKDICYATTNRQKATEKLACKCDYVIVVGSKNSSNSNRLRETAEKICGGAFLADSFSEVPKEVFENHKIIGMTSGASVPENILESFLGEIRKKYFDISVENLNILDENVVFPSPKI